MKLPPRKSRKVVVRLVRLGLALLLAFFVISEAEELRDCADLGVDIASGLGEKVYVAGISASGTMAASVAQNRSESPACC
jgi:hypothetical protein